MAITKQLNPSVEEELKKYNEERFKSYDINKYNWKLHQYPEGLGTKPDLLHYVAFYVNVREKSIRKNQGAFDTFNKGDINILQTTKKITREQLGDSLPAVVGVQTALLSLGISSVGSLLEKSQPKISGNARQAGKEAIVNIFSGLKTIGIAGALGAAAYGLTEFAQKELDILKTTTFLRLKDVITLHVEDRPTVKYGTNYTEADLGILAGLIASGVSALQTIKNSNDFNLDSLTTLAKGFGTEGAAALGLTLAKLPMGIGGGKAEDIVGAAAGIKINPFREALFESIDYRTFNFKYRFFPKSKKETENIKNIVDTFKIHMHPDLSDNNLFFIYPSEFEIVYYYVDPKTGRNKENPYLYRIGNCALTDMAVEYGGDTFSTFDNGAPTQVNLTLTFRELEQLTKREMRRGF